MEFPNFMIGNTCLNGPCSIAMLVFWGVLLIVGPQLAMIWFGDSLSIDNLLDIFRGVNCQMVLSGTCATILDNAHI